MFTMPYKCEEIVSCLQSILFNKINASNPVQNLDTHLKIRVFLVRFIYKKNAKINIVLIHFIMIFLFVSLERVIHLFY